MPSQMFEHQVILLSSFCNAGTSGLILRIIPSWHQYPPNIFQQNLLNAPISLQLEV